MQQISSSENTIAKGNHNDGTKEKKIIGIVQLAFAYLFEQIKLRKSKSVYYIIHCSYLEVYNEQVRIIRYYNNQIIVIITN